MSDLRFRVRRIPNSYYYLNGVNHPRWGVYRPYQDGPERFIPCRSWSSALEVALKLVDENQDFDLVKEAKEAVTRFQTDEDNLGCSECGYNSVDANFLNSADDLMPLLIAEIEDLREQLRITTGGR
ncbi:hypothetical protein [Mycobacteroides abscessus]|uniref:hypothetical protein n=1 Tax=Mycobacteroides abscessus TaxID=36809 RepID=UPI00078B3967|nr:hypothetical protein [Mycobacteroides abscessus]AMU64804.1 hypothetical protein A3O04_05535 [Mycobacteroides abscessus]ANO13414.1 hypothetical protein BAB77_05670 [Mycobacteroides abscessus]MBE5405744.1 hypothetical protein [Mycobacteroides abscessus]MBE5429545.1 hypothetical protein [Mycobacteroides abscessus]MBE5498560.1 hypothetical protein [Mycobacteroides abscessus]